MATHNIKITVSGAGRLKDYIEMRSIVAKADLQLAVKEAARKMHEEIKENYRRRFGVE